MDYDSPDWDRTPTESIEVKDEAPHLTKAEAVESSTNDTKLELTKKEEDSPQHTPMLCPPVSTVPDKTSTTSTSPPAKAPPVSHTSYRNLSTRNTPQTNPKPPPTQPTAIPPHPTAPPAPPSTTSPTSTEDPVILTTNVPILPKARPGHPPINTTWVGPHNCTMLHIQQHLHASPYRSPFHVPTGMANFYPSIFPMTSNTTSIPQHIPLDDQPHRVPYHQLTSAQPLPPTPPQCSHQYLLFQTRR